MKVNAESKGCVRKTMEWIAHLAWYAIEPFIKVFGSALYKLAFYGTIPVLVISAICGFATWSLAMFFAMVIVLGYLFFCGCIGIAIAEYLLA